MQALKCFDCGKQLVDLVQDNRGLGGYCTRCHAYSFHGTASDTPIFDDTTPLPELVSISKAEYEGLKRFRNHLAWYWSMYLKHRNSSNRLDYDDYMVSNQIDGVPDAKYARLAYWYQLAEKRNNEPGQE